MAGLLRLAQILARQHCRHDMLDAPRTDAGAKGVMAALRPTDPEYARQRGVFTDSWLPC